MVVATSNVAPGDLYKDGLNRALFLPFVALMRERLDIVELRARADFRLEKLARAPVYYCPDDARATAALDATFSSLTGAARGEPMEIALLGRACAFPRRSTASRASPSTISAAARSARRTISRSPNAFTQSSSITSPGLRADERNEARRLITLVDALYDMKVKLIASAAAEPADLYPAPTARKRSNSPASPRASSRCARSTISASRTAAGGLTSGDLGGLVET